MFTKEEAKYKCIMCYRNIPETPYHMFWDCEIAKQIWYPHIHVWELILKQKISWKKMLFANNIKMKIKDKEIP